jgi:hypothetical protein
MSNLERMFHPADFLSHLLHFRSEARTVAPDPSQFSVVDFSLTRVPATDNPCAGAGPAKLARGDGTVYAIPFVQEMVMDLP